MSLVNHDDMGIFLTLLKQPSKFQKWPDFVNFFCGMLSNANHDDCWLKSNAPIFFIQQQKKLWALLPSLLSSH